MTTKEEWKDIDGYEGLYQVSTLGRVRNNRGKILKCSVGTNGYLTLHLYNRTKRKPTMIHRIVAENFLGNETDKQVNHINGNKLDNRLENLEWISPSENIVHSYRNGLKKTKAVNQYDEKHTFIKRWEGMAEASRKLGISIYSISGCCRNKTKTAHGFIFEYAN